MTDLPAIPEPADYDRETFEAVVPYALRWLDGCDDIEILFSNILNGMLAIEDYLARKGEDVGPAQTVARMTEVRIGEVLGPATMGRPAEKVTARGNLIHHSRRTEFRLMAQYRQTVEESLPAPRAVILAAIKRRRMRHIDDNARVVRTGVSAGDRYTLRAVDHDGRRLHPIVVRMIDGNVAPPAPNFFEAFPELQTLLTRVNGIFRPDTQIETHGRIVQQGSAFFGWRWPRARSYPGQPIASKEWSAPRKDPRRCDRRATLPGLACRRPPPPALRPQPHPRPSTVAFPARRHQVVQVMRAALDYGHDMVCDVGMPAAPVADVPVTLQHKQASASPVAPIWRRCHQYAPPIEQR